MIKVANNMLELIGVTPMVKLQHISQDIPAEIWTKIEFVNPSGSIKDRIAYNMVIEAEKRGDLKPGATIVEPTSGNTGIAFSLVAALRGYKMIAVMPEVESIERRKMMEMLGAKVELVKCVAKDKGLTKEDIEAADRRARELVQEIPGAYMPNQFENPDNPSAHAQTTAQEIIAQTEGKFAAYVAACGTGGTFSGVARVLQERFPHIKCIVVEPAGAAVLSGCEPAFHKIQGIGEGFVPKVMDTSLIDQIVTVEDDEAINMTRRLWKEEGVLSGISGGANVFAALQVGRQMQQGQVVVTVIPDSGMRYFSTELF